MIKKMMFVILFLLSVNNTNAMGLPGGGFPGGGMPGGGCSMYYDSYSCNMASGCSRSYMTWSCQSGSSCGNGTVEFGAGEQCDDWNTSSGDGCSATCQNETRCGDGTRQTPNQAGFNEACDDGNNMNGDGCSSSCSVELRCGDGTIQTPNSFGVTETCDDGNTTNGDGCNSTCSIETRCGDGVVQTPNSAGVNEVCDDGNTVGGDTCNATCTAVISNTCDFNYNTNALSCINNGVDFQNKKEIFRSGSDIYYQDNDNPIVYYKNSDILNTGLGNAGTHDIKYSNGYIFYYVNNTFFKRSILDMSNYGMHYYSLSNSNGYGYLTDGRYVLFRAPNGAGGWSYYNKLDTVTGIETSNSVNFSEGWAYDFNGLYGGIFFARNHHNTGVSTWVVRLNDGATLSLPISGYSSQDILGEDENYIYFNHFDGFVYKLNKVGTLSYVKTDIQNLGKIYMFGDKIVTYQYSSSSSFMNATIKIYNVDGTLITEGNHNLLYNGDEIIGLKEKNNNLYLGVFTTSNFTYNSSTYGYSWREIIKVNLISGEFVYSSIGPTGLHFNPSSSYNQAKSDLDDENVFYFYRSTFTRKYVKIAVNIWENTWSSGDVNGNYTHYILNQLNGSYGNMQQVNNSAVSTNFSNHTQVKSNFLANYNYMQSWYESKGLTMDVINNNVDWANGVTFSKTDVAGGMLDGYKLSAHYPFMSYKETDNNDNSIFWRTDLSNTSFQSDTTWAIGIPAYPIRNGSGGIVAYLQFPCGNLICKDQYCSDIKKIINPTPLNPIDATVFVNPGNGDGWCGDGIKNTMDEECDTNDGVEHNKGQTCNSQCKIETSPGITPGCPSFSALAFKCNGNSPALIFPIDNTLTPPDGNTGTTIPSGGTGTIIKKEVSWTPTLPPPPNGVTDDTLYNDIVNFFPIEDDIGLYKDLICETTQTGTKISDKIIVIDSTLEDSEFISKLKNKEDFITKLIDNNDLANRIIEEKLKTSKLNQKSNLYDLGNNGNISGIQFNLTEIPNSAIIRKLVDLAIDHSSTTMAEYEKTVKDSCNGNITSTGTMIVPAGFVNTNTKGDTILNLFRYNSPN